MHDLLLNYCWQVNKSYEYANIWKWILFFGFFITIFLEKAQNKKQSLDQNDFLLTIKLRKAKSPKQVHFCLVWDERIFFWKT